jgi:hypothetical protein
MSAQTQLDRLDALIAEQSHFHYIQPAKLDPGGIDPLGMAPTNLELISSALPGINNVTSRIRVYSFLAWAWWRARECFVGRGADRVDAAKLQELVDRWEVLFVWSNMLAGTNRGLAGRQKLGGNLPEAGTYKFHGPRWDTLRAVRHSGQTNLQAAVNYGPSLKALLWVIPYGSGAFVPSEQAMPAVKALDARVGELVPARLLRPDAVGVSVQEAKDMHSAWNTEKPSKAEKKAFRELYYEVGLQGDITGDGGLRARTLRLIQSALEQSPEPLSEHDLRRTLASHRFPDGSAFVPSDDLLDGALLWTAIQARQLQRQALEALLGWVENYIDESGGQADAAALVQAADAASRDGEAAADTRSVSAYLNAVQKRGAAAGWPAACAWDEGTDIFDLIDALVDAVREEDWKSIPPLALRAIALAEAVSHGVRDCAGGGGSLRHLLEGNPDRLPLAAASKRLDLLGASSMRDLWEEILLSWVIAQHVRWAVARNGDGTQRLRITLDEGGWVRLRSDHRTITPMGDRLATALSLAAECGLIEQNQDGGGVLYSAA